MLVAFSFSDIKIAVDWLRGLLNYAEKRKQAVRQKQILECARVVRNFAAHHKRGNPNVHCYPKDRIAMQQSSPGSNPVLPCLRYFLPIMM